MFKFTTFKLKLIAGVAILAALAIALFAAHRIGYSKGHNESAIEIVRYKNEVIKLQDRIITAQARVDTKVITQYVTKIVTQHRLVTENRDIIKTVVVNRPTNLATGWIYGYNQSVLGLPIDPKLAADFTAAPYSDNEVLVNVGDNLAIGNSAITQLEALQQWLCESEKERAKITNDKPAIPSCLSTGKTSGTNN